MSKILANDPPYQIEERVESRIDAIRKCLIHALSNTPTSNDDQKYLIGTETRQFEFIAYAPQAFEDLMALWNKHVPKLKLLNSLKKGELRQISNPNGRLSNVDIFIKTADQLFFIKDVKTGKEMLTVKDQKANRTKPKAELDFFWKHFKSYCVRIEEEFKFYGQQSLLPKFFALFGIKDNSYGVPGEERMFLVMKNLIPEKQKNDPITEKKNDNDEMQQIYLDFAYKFDVKGSLDHQKLPAIKRYPKDGKNPTFRFLDLYDETEKKTSEANRAMLKEKREGCFFRNGILLEDDVYTKFIGILARDALVALFNF
uniref:Restriction endonuclease n=1 Tax=Globodera pallida TaxID=36090 RepID=A0A183CA03_GLOPA